MNWFLSNVNNILLQIDLSSSEIRPQPELINMCKEDLHFMNCSGMVILLSFTLHTTLDCYQKGKSFCVKKA